MIVVCMAYDRRFEELAAVSVPLAERYCQKHGYAFIRDRIDEREGDACKIRLFNTLYATGAYDGNDVFFWLDTDALIMNSDEKLEPFAERMREKHVLYGCDPNGINTGTWFARFTSHADHFLRVAQQKSASMGWADQEGIIQTYVQPAFTSRVAVVPGKGFNSMLYDLYGWDWSHKHEINAYEPGDLVLHFPGIEFSQRVELMRQHAKDAV